MAVFGPFRPSRTTLAAVVLALLLSLLAVLQYRWIGEVSRAERERLGAAPDHFAEEFDRELTRAFLSFQPGLAHSAGAAPAAPTTPTTPVPPGIAVANRKAALVQQARRWRTQAPVPQLLRAIYVEERGADGALALSRLDPAGERFVPVPWPAGLQALRQRLAEGRVPPIDGEDAVLVLPLVHSMMEPGGERGHVLLELDRDFIAGSFLPELAERWFEVSQKPQVLLAVQTPGGLVYRSDRKLPGARFLPGDITVKMFGLRRIENLHGLVPGGFPGPPSFPKEPAPPGFHRPGPGSGHSGPPGGHRHGYGSGTWTLVVTHPAGSLEAAVARARWRNLAVSFGALALVAASLVVMGLSARRARLIARQQLELVAGITHELNTPLAAIRSAGQNLADGVVAESGQVRRYGALIEREGARLSGMVAKALELAGIQSGRRLYRYEPVAVEDVVAEALADGRFLLEERQIRVAREIPPGLPPVWADRAALRMALVNLLDNAAKYASAGQLVTVRAAAARGGRGGRGGRQVSLTVEDRGPGIRAEDRPHLFEPFFRGREVATGGVPGSGLGLSLVRRIVEAHRGTVSVAAGPGGKGSAFTLHLPTAPEPAGALGAAGDVGAAGDAPEMEEAR
ncbi:MAG: two-component system, OmpR family, phosphate regulon sensor histidine kinase PhoR [Acidobacteriota bacterium]|nr:two-component system, OmpR family, phosphate regulon sensor histidine kinase PhoR [Acidobacteriota bacterium]